MARSSDRPINPDHETIALAKAGSYEAWLQIVEHLEADRDDLQRRLTEMIEQVKGWTDRALKAERRCDDLEGWLEGVREVGDLAAVRMAERGLSRAR